MYTAIAILSAIAITALCLLLFHKKSDKAFGVFMKVLVLIFCAMGFFRFMLSDAFILVMEGVFKDGKQEHDAWLQIILRCCW